MECSTSQLQGIPDGSLFSEISDQLQGDPPIYKKIRTCQKDKDWPDGDIVIEPMNLPQFAEIPGERNRLGYTDKDGKRWHVWTEKEVQQMIGWLMTSRQYSQAESLA